MEKSTRKAKRRNVKMRIILRKKKFSHFSQQDYLKKNGFIYCVYPQNSYCEKITASQREIKKWQQYAKRHSLMIDVKDEKYSRSSNYRSEFFAHTRPFIKDRYFCIYCGKLLKKEKLEVDHIIPVFQVQTNKTARKILKRKHIVNVNDVRNLGTSCRNCNQKKGSKIDGWVFRGYIGKSNTYQVIRLIIRFVLMVCLIWIFLNIFCDYGSGFLHKVVYKN